MLPHNEQLTATKSVHGTGSTTASASDASRQRGETLCAHARLWRARDTHQSGVGVGVACRCSRQREKPAQAEERDEPPPRALQHRPREGSSRDSGKRAEQSLRPPHRLALLPTVRAVPEPRVGTGLPQPRAPSHVAPAGEGPGSTLIFSTRWALPRKARDCPNTEKGSDTWLSAIRPRK